MNKKSKILFVLTLVIVTAAAAYVFFNPKEVEAETAEVKKGIFVEEIRADAFFRAKKRYTVTAFADGDIQRVDLKVGDVVKKNQTITQLYWDVKYDPIKSPINGVVTKVIRESAGPVHRGEAIVEVVDPSDLEIVAEMLTTDAAKVQVGNIAIATGWGESKNIFGKVAKISKAGFSKISALGVEEERTEVIMEADKLSSEEKTKLGHNFHTQVIIQTAKVDSALKIPVGALLRSGSEWAVYQVVDTKARLKPIKLSLRGNEEVVVSEGLNEGDVVVNYPGDLIKDGTKIKKAPNK